MGYDHYWHRPVELPADAFAAWASDVRKVIEATSVSIRGPDGEGDPVITASEVAFNGDARQTETQSLPAFTAFKLRNSADGTHLERHDEQAFPARTYEHSLALEAFIMRRHDSTGISTNHPTRWFDRFDWRFFSCKTNWRPYDEVVTASLALLAHRFPRLCAVTSDGKLTDWEDGIALAELATGIQVGMPGYQHYWAVPATLDPAAYARWARDVARVIETAQVPLAGPDGTGQPIVTDTHVAFNGIGDDAYGAFNWPLVGNRRPNAHTGQRPYDIVVTAALILMAHYLPDCLVQDTVINLSGTRKNIGNPYFDSTGETKDWEPGLALAQRATGRNLTIPTLK